MSENTTTYDESSRLRLANQVMELFEAWGVALEDQVSLLGFSKDVKKRSLNRYREDTPLPDDESVIERAEHIMGIADALRTYFPNSVHARSRFMRTNSKKFPKATPLQIMVKDGLSGLIRIRSHLDCTYAWDLSGSKA